jgi:hypothetical protein
MKEPIEMKAGDERVLVNGLPLPVDYRIVWEENYKELKRAFDLANVSKSLSNEDAKFIYNLLPDWVKSKAPEGLDPTMYGTLNKEGDDEIQERVKQILGNVC